MAASPVAIGEAEFAGLMRALGPFESAPRLAVAVSGGADSMALCLLAAAWARAAGGEAVALTVDHRLRPESAAEAAQVAGWLAARGIAHRILAWEGPKPASGVQEAARAARYRLLEGWCRRHGVLHLLLAHHREDQAETFLLRLRHGSGVSGLSAMSAVSETAAVRLLRPLLDVPRARLAATLGSLRQPWIDDPSNRNPAFERVRLRRAMPALAEAGLTAERLAASARRAGRARAALEAEVARAAARWVTPHPAGFAWCGEGALAAADDVALRLLAGLLRMVGGHAYPPRAERLERLLADLRAGARARTLAGCVVARRGGGRLLIHREEAAMAPPLAVAGSGVEVVWDGRFRIAVDAPPEAGCRVGALGREGWREVAGRLATQGRRASIPAAVRPALPALRDAHGISEVPHLRYKRRAGEGGPGLRMVVLAPRVPLTALWRNLV